MSQNKVTKEVFIRFAILEPERLHVCNSFVNIISNTIGFGEALCHFIVQQDKTRK